MIAKLHEFIERKLAEVLISEAVAELHRKRRPKPTRTNVRLKVVELAESYRQEHGLDPTKFIKGFLDEWPLDEDGLLKPHPPTLDKRELLELWEGLREIDLRPAKTPTISVEERALLSRLIISTRRITEAEVNEIYYQLNEAARKPDPGGAEYAVARMLSLILYRRAEPSSLSITSGLTEALKRVKARMEGGIPIYEIPVYWRGRVSEGKYLHAPPGGPDIICVTLTGCIILGEVTLRMTARQWEDEIEPIWRHAEEVRKELENNMLLLFIMPRVREDTFNRIRDLSRPYFPVTTLTFEQLFSLARILPYVQVIRHEALESLLKRLQIVPFPKRTFPNIDTYMEFSEKSLREWIRDAAEKALSIFFTTKIYGELIRLGGEATRRSIVRRLSQDQEVRRFLGILGFGEVGERGYGKVIEGILRGRRIFNLLESYNLASIKNDKLDAVDPDEAVNTLLYLIGRLSLEGEHEHREALGDTIGGSGSESGNK